MSRRTPIDDLVAEEAGTSSPIRRSSRIATRRTSAAEEIIGQKLRQHEDESDRISISSTSSVGSKSGKKNERSTKSPLPLNNEEIGKAPVRRGRKGSTSSLVEEELASINRGGSPTPTRITRRSLARSMSASPTLELENKKRNISQRSISESSSKPGLLKRSLKMSTSEVTAPLESIEERSPQKEKVTTNSIENTDEKDLPLKKKKSALLQTITENSFTETNKTEYNLNCSSNEESKVSRKSLEKTEVEVNSKKDKENVSIEEKELKIVLTDIQKTNDDIYKSKDLCVPQNKSNDSSKEAVELDIEDEHINLHISESDEDGRNDNNSVAPSTIAPQIIVNGIENNTVSDTGHVQTSSVEIKSARNDNLNVSKNLKAQVDSAENDINPNVSKDAEQLNLTVQAESAENDHDLNVSNNSEQLNLKAQVESAENDINPIDSKDSEQPNLKVQVESAKIDNDSNVTKNADQLNLKVPLESGEIDNDLNVSKDAEQLNLEEQTSACVESDKNDNDANVTKDTDQLHLKVPLESGEIDNDPNVSKDSEQLNLEEQTSACVESDKNDNDANVSKYSEQLNLKVQVEPGEIDNDPNVSKDPEQLNLEEQTSVCVESTENENGLNVSKDGKQLNLEVQTSVCVKPADCSASPTSTTLNLLSKPEILSRSSKELQISLEQDKIVDKNDSLTNINFADSVNSAYVKAQSTPVLKETSASSKTLTPSKIPEVTVSSSKKKKSTDESNAVETNQVIVSASLTPLRRSPRLNHSDKKLRTSCETLTEDVLKINTPPDSIKSGNLSGDTDHELKNDSKELDDKNVSNDENKSDIEEKNLKDSKKDVSVINSVNKSKNDISFSSEPELNTSLMKKITELTNNIEVENDSDESAHNFIDDMAEEAEEDTPSEGSNDIVDLGESIGSTESEIDSDESYEVDSFIDDEEEGELLSGEEYDLDQTKSKRKPTKKRSRIIQIIESSDEEKNKELEHKIQGNKEAETTPKKKELNHKFEEDSDVENMSTRAYCGLTPPSVVSIRDSPSDEENKDFNNKEDEESITSVLINKEDNLESLEHIKDSIPENLNKSLKNTKKTPVKDSPAKVPVPAQEKRKSRTPNNSILETSTSKSNSVQRKRLSSLNIQETVNAKDISDGSISDRIMKVVEAFCSTVTKSGDNPEGNISLNVSFDYVSTSPNKPNIHKEHSEIIVIEPSPEKTPAKSEFLTSPNARNSVKMKSPLVLFSKDSSSDEQVSDDKEKNQGPIKPKNFQENKVQTSKLVEKSSEDELTKKSKRKKRKSTETISTTMEKEAAEERSPLFTKGSSSDEQTSDEEEENNEVPMKCEFLTSPNRSNSVKMKSPLVLVTKDSSSDEQVSDDEEKNQGPIKPRKFQENIVQTSKLSEKSSEDELSKKSKKKKRKSIGTISTTMEKEAPEKRPPLYTKTSSSYEQVSNDEGETNKVPMKLSKFQENKIPTSKLAEKSSEDELSKKSKKKKRKSTGTISTSMEKEADEERPPLSKRQKKKGKTTKKEMKSESDSDMSPDLDKELTEKYQNRGMEGEDSSSEVYNTKSDSSNERKKLKRNNQKMSLSDISNAGLMKASKKSKKTRSENEFVGDENVSPSTSKEVLHKTKESQHKPRLVREKRVKVPNVSNEGGWQIEYLPKEIKVALSLGRTNYQTQQSNSQQSKSAPKKKPKLIPTVNGGKESWNSDKVNVTPKPTSSHNSKNSNVESFHPKDFRNRTLFDSKRVKRMATRELLKMKEKTNY